MLQRLNKWSAVHNPPWLILIRAALGICLFVKGITFISNIADLESILKGGGFERGSLWIAYAITWIHLFGGFMIIIGLFTRLAVLIQIPILIGALIFGRAHTGILSAETAFLFPLLILILLLFFLLEGGGPLSLDRFIKTHQL